MRTDYAVVTARSPRVVVLIPSGSAIGPRGGSAALDRVLEWFGRVWGGAYMLCVPVTGDEIDPLFRRLVDAYDPDVVLVWQLTLGAMAVRDIDAARAYVAEKRTTIGANNVLLDALVDDDDLRNSRIRLGSDVAEMAVNGLLGQLSAFSTPVARYAHVAWHLQDDLPAPLTLLSSLAVQPSANSQGRLSAGAEAPGTANEALSAPQADLDLMALNPWLQRLLKVRLGVVGANEANEPAGLRATDELVWRHTVGEDDIYTALTVGIGGRTSGRQDGWAAGEVLARMPLARTRTGLQEWSYSGPAQRPFILVVGDSVEDCCLYLCWLRTYGPDSAAWLPAAAAQGGDDKQRWLDSAKELVRELLLDLPGQTYTRGWITSFSMTPQNLEPLKKQLSSFHWQQGLAERFAAMPVVEPNALLVDEPPSVFPAVGDVFDHAVPMLLDEEGNAAAIFRSPVPQLMTRPGSIVSGDLLGNWVGDVTVGRCRLPRRRAAAAAAELDASLIEAGVVRAGRTGTSFVAVADAKPPHGLLVEHALTGLSLRDPSMQVLLDALVPSGWSWQLSDAGRFYQGFADMIGGLPGLVAILRDRAAMPVLNAFLGRGHSAPGLQLTDKRWYLRLSECRKAAAAQGRPTTVPEMRSVIDRMLGQGVLTRGLVLKCSRCRHTAFHSLDEVGRDFNCVRCLFRQPLLSGAWCDTPPNEPAWFYRLDELVYQALTENVVVPALALAELGAEAAQARHGWSFELWRGPNRQLELDFACLVDGRLSVGEAKVNGKFDGNAASAVAEVRKTLHGATLLAADHVVFATTQSAWAPAASTAIQAQVSDGDRPVPLLLAALT